MVASTGINPNLLTFFGLLVNCWAAVMFALGKFRSGAMIIFFAAFLDMLDGQVARREKRVTAFGAFFDSTLDRYSDMALYMGLLVYYAQAGRGSYVILAAVATAGSVMVSYSRARAESLIPLCKVGFMERPERMVLLILGGLVQPHGPRAVGHFRGSYHDRHSPHLLHLAGNQSRTHAAGHSPLAVSLSPPVPQIEERFRVGQTSCLSCLIFARAHKKRTDKSVCPTAR